jgi:hypothetical protein
MTEPADALTIDHYPVDEPAEGSTEVVYVKARPRKLKHLFESWHPHEDLTCCHGSGRACWNDSPLPDWEDQAYYVSNCVIKHSETGLEMPAGTPFLLAELTEGKPLALGLDETHPVPVADYMCMVCLDPRDSKKMLSFGYWHGIQDDQSHKYDKVENEMLYLAIAATGLAL